MSLRNSFVSISKFYRSIRRLGGLPTTKPDVSASCMAEKSSTNDHVDANQSDFSESQINARFEISSVTRDDKNKLLHITWQNGVTSRFAYVWLRDNCPASHTYQLSDICKARKLLMNDLDPDVEPLSVQNSRQSIRVKWPEEKWATYSSEWLALRNLDDQRIRAGRRVVDLNDLTEIWTRKTSDSKNVRWYNFDQIMSDDRTLHDALMETCKFGILFIDRAPAQVGQMRRLAQRIGFEYLTHYGHFFTVKSDSNPTNMAYTSAPLGFHSDLPYFQYAPQLQGLHCIEQTRAPGGENQFADGYAVAEQLRLEQPSAYKILCSVPLEYIDDGKDFIKFDMAYRRPVFNFDANGRLSEVHFSSQQRSWFYDVPVEKIREVYLALKMFNNYLYKPENCLRIKMESGQMALFHNLRVLHARGGFEISPESGGRHLEGCYLNWDIVKSKIRILRDQCNIEPNQVSV